MTCRELTELLLEYVSEELACEVRQQVEEHLHVCKHCVAYTESYRVTIHISRRLPCAQLPEHLRCRCEELLRQHGDTRPD